ncbi:hypothetical protein N0V90_000449 [Kalmusia sp. IMI 367209]|nr:hypothetical protein N0V90_000449 [Kalmusia sp. IMI 367209]
MDARHQSKTTQREHRPEDFKPPYIIRNTIIYANSTTTPDRDVIFALNDCLLAGRSLLDVFLGMTTYSLRNVPVIVYTRMFYATVIFAKLYTSAQSLDSQFGGLIDLQSLAFDTYLWRLINALQAAQGTEDFRVPKVFLSMLERLSQWSISRLQFQLNEYQAGLADEELQPMNYADPLDPSGSMPSMSTDDTLATSDSWALNFDTVFTFLDT